MIEIFKSNESGTLEKVENIEENTWINLVTPSTEEIKTISDFFDLPEEHLRAALDTEEQARLEIDDDITLIVVDIPIHDEKNKFSYTTIPLAIIHLPDNIITISTISHSILEEFTYRKIKDFFTFKKTRFVLQILYRNSVQFLYFLRQIARVGDATEKQLKKSMRNQELMLLLEIEKSLVYFTTSLKSNEVVLEKLRRTSFVKKDPDDFDLMEDVIIENKQAIEMAQTYANILANTRDAFSTLISNNLNIVMKKLTLITIVLAIPTIISGLWGMNVVDIPFAHTPNGFFIVLGLAISLGLILVWLLFKKDIF